MSARALRLLVSGTVQGVGYRDWTLRAAQALGLSGWVRNLADGRVEIWAEGQAAAIEALRAQVARGPRHAHVMDTRADPVVPRGAVGFARRPTAEAPEPLTSSG